MTGIPRLDDIAADPTKASALPLEVIKALLVRCHVVEGALVSGLLVAQTTPRAEPDEPDTLLTPHEVAQRCNADVSWVYAHAKRWPFTRRLSRKVLRFSARGLDKWLTAKKSVER